MDELYLAKQLSGNTSTEEKVEVDNPTNASIVYMIAVTASSNGEVVLRPETEEDGEWAEGDYTEVDEDGDFEEVEEETEDVDDSVLDLTDGDGVDIEDTENTAYTVVAYHSDAVAAYAEETAAEEEPEVVEDDLAGDDAGISDEIDDGDATELPDDGEGEAVEDDLAGDDADIDEISDDDYTLTNSEEDDISDIVEGAEISDGNTIAECIGSVKAGDRVAVMVQNGKMVVVGTPGSGDETTAEVVQLVESMKITNLEVENLKVEKADIDLANIKEGCIKAAMIGKGVVGTAQIADGSITDAKIVELAANKITAGTLSVERLEIRGSDASVVYALNNITGALQSQNVDTLNGEILTERTITADKIVADSITSNEIASKTITANEIDVDNLFAQDITATGIIRGASLIGAEGEFSGKISANEGSIGDFEIIDGFLSSERDSNIGNKEYSLITIKRNILSKEGDESGEPAGTLLFSRKATISDRTIRFQYLNPDGSYVYQADFGEEGLYLSSEDNPFSTQIGHGYISVDGNIESTKNIYAGEAINTEGDISALGDLTVGGTINGSRLRIKNTYGLSSIDSAGDSYVNIAWVTSSDVLTIGGGNYPPKGIFLRPKDGFYVRAESSFISEKAIYTGGKTSFSDGLPGGQLGANGRLYLVGTDDVPGIHFYHNQTSSGGSISYDASTDLINVAGADLTVKGTAVSLSGHEHSWTKVTATAGSGVTITSQYCAYNTALNMGVIRLSLNITPTADISSGNLIELASLTGVIVPNFFCTLSAYGSSNSRRWQAGFNAQGKIVTRGNTALTKGTTYTVEIGGVYPVII